MKAVFAYWCRKHSWKERWAEPKQSDRGSWRQKNQLKEKKKKMLHRTESCSPFTSNTVIWPLFMIQYWFVRLQSCDLWERPEFEGSFKTVWGQHIHLLLITPFIATFGCSLTFIKELRCSCTLDWDWTQPLRPTVWRHHRGHLRELWPGPRVRVWDDMAGGDRRDKRRQRSRLGKKKSRVESEYIQIASHMCILLPHYGSKWFILG